MEQRPKYWSLYSDAWGAVVAQARPLEQLMTARPFSADELGQVAARNGLPVHQLVFWPLLGVNTDFSVILNRANGSIVEVLAVDPWME